MPGKQANEIVKYKTESKCYFNYEGRAMKRKSKKIS